VLGLLLRFLKSQQECGGHFCASRIGGNSLDHTRKLCRNNNNGITQELAAAVDSISKMLHYANTALISSHAPSGAVGTNVQNTVSLNKAGV
jgi:hypothetical protein